MVFCDSDIPVSGALGRHGRVPGPVGAIVVDGVLVAYPAQAAVLRAVEVLKLSLVPPPRALSGAELGLDGGLAAVDVEAAV